MKFVGLGTEDDMIATFLISELYSLRYGKVVRSVAEKLKVPLSIISNPDVHDKAQNRQRSKVLSSYRGWKENKKIFKNFPEIKRWEWYELERNDILNLNYVDYSYWNELSRGTHSVKEAVKSIRKGIEIFGEPNKQFFKLAAHLNKSGKITPLILLDLKEDAPIQILEGHVRATAIGLSGNNSLKITALIGKNWGEL